MFDWFTLAAQIINFLILVFLLKHFLYNRIIEVMEKRKKRIASRLDDAQQKEESAEQKKHEYEKKLEEIETLRKEKVKEAEEEAEKRRKELLKDARQEVDQSQEEWRKSLEQEQDRFLNDLRQLTGEQAYAVSRHILEDLAGKELEEQIASAFLARLQRVKEDEQETYQTLQQISEDTPLHLSSASEMSEEMQSRITETLHKVSDGKPEIQFAVNPDLIGGIELRVNGTKIAWSIAGYLNALEDEWNDALQQHIAEKEHKAAEA